MMALLSPLKRIILQVGLLLCCYFLSRCVFTLINIGRFGGLSLAEFLRLCFYALRFDISTIVTLNAVYFALLLLPLPVWKMPVYERITQWLFIVINSIAFAFEISDWAYFPFTLKRATNDVLDMIGRQGDFLNHLPHFLIDYWYAPLGFILLIILFTVANNRIRGRAPLTGPSRMTWGIGIGKTFLLAFVIGLCVLGMRGGLQLIPLGNGNALTVTDNKYVPIVLNTPFSVMHSYSGKLEEVHYFPEADLKKYFDPIKHYGDKPFQKKNVVLIILESFSKEYTGLGGRQSFTPFLDSLMQYSYVCRNAFANSLTSAEGIPAVISGMPSLMEEPITTSSYGTDKLTSLPALLRDKGYQTAFYHGGTNGTMSFDVFTSNAGFSKYYGRKEYNNEADFDGSWGIWDEPFLQYFARGLNGMQQPFMASVFTLTSHDPFKVPEQYKDKLSKGTLPIQQCIAYTDMSLKKFFETASREPWFRNTLFVFTADHASPGSKDPYYSSLKMGSYAIPIMFYAPGDSTLRNGTDSVVQQIDILPTVLDYLGYDQKFFAFGSSMFRHAYPRYVVNEMSGSYLWYMNGYLYTTAGLSGKALYDFRKDSLCRNNILPQKMQEANEEIIPHFKAFIQLYRSSLIRNKLSAD